MKRAAPQESTRETSARRPFDLVVVCTGNRARSPIAEAFLQASLAELPVRIRSLGTLDVGPLPPLRDAVEVARAHGMDIRAHRARCVRREWLEEVDLVVGFETSHLASAALDSGARPERVFTMPELVRLLEAIESPSPVEPLSRAREAIARAHASRIGIAEAPPEIADPLGGSPRVYRETVAQIRDLSVRLAVGLFGAALVRSLPGVGERSVRRRAPREPRRRGLRDPLS